MQRLRKSHLEGRFVQGYTLAENFTPSVRTPQPAKALDLITQNLDSIASVEYNNKSYC
jgi:hypothetical protein